MNIYELKAKDLFKFRGHLHMKTRNAYPHNSVNINTGEVVTIPMKAELIKINSTLKLKS